MTDHETDDDEIVEVGDAVHGAAARRQPRGADADARLARGAARVQPKALGDVEHAAALVTRASELHDLAAVAVVLLDLGDVRVQHRLAEDEERDVVPIREQRVRVGGRPVVRVDLGYCRPGVSGIGGCDDRLGAAVRAVRRGHDHVRREQRPGAAPQLLLACEVVDHHGLGVAAGGAFAIRGDLGRGARASAQRSETQQREREEARRDHDP